MRINKFIGLIVIIFPFWVGIAFCQNQNTNDFISIFPTFWFTTDDDNENIHFFTDSFPHNRIKIIVNNHQFIELIKTCLDNSKDTITINDNRINNFRIAFILNKGFNKDTVLFNDFNDFMMINSKYYKFDWSLLFLIINKIPLHYKEQVEEVFSIYLNRGFKQ